MSLDPGRQPNGRWRRGHSGNPEGRRVEQDPERRRVRELARSYSHEAVEALRGIMLSEEAQAMARVQAAKEILSRGWGTATDEATLDALDRGEEEDRMILFRMPMSIDGVEIEDAELVDDQPPALPPPAA